MNNCAACLVSSPLNIGDLLAFLAGLAVIGYGWWQENRK